MKKIILLFIMAVLCTSCGQGVSQEEYDKLTKINNGLSEEIENLKLDLEEVKQKNQKLEKEKAKEVEEKLKLATPNAWATTHFGNDCIVLAENTEYLQVISKKKYNLSNKGVQKIWKKTLEASTTLGVFLDKINYKRIGIKFPQDNGNEMIEIVLKRENESYGLESVSGDLFNADILVSAIQKIN